MKFRLAMIGCAALYVGCSSAPPTGGPDGNVIQCTAANNFCADAASAGPDAGVDAGVPPDAGAQPDASNASDSGTPPDSGVKPDAGIPPDAGSADAGIPLCLWDQTNWDQCLWQ